MTLLFTTNGIRTSSIPATHITLFLKFTHLTKNSYIYTVRTSIFTL